MAEHVWKDSGNWERYSKGHQRVGKQFRCIRCGCVVQTSTKGDIRTLDLEDAGVDPDCNVQVVGSVMKS